DYIAHMRANIFNLLKDSLIRKFGKEIEPHVWDLVIIYNGIFHGYFFMMFYESKLLSIKDVSIYIVERIEDIVAGILSRQPQPILPNQMMTEYVESGLAGLSITIAEQK